MLWYGPSHIHKLSHSINEMFAHGLFLLSCAPDKSREAMLLALDLKVRLKDFVSLPDEEQKSRKQAFIKDFTSTLHSKDSIMSVHREYWKVIVANILITMTGVGLVAIGVNYFATGNVFFAKTRSEQRVEAVENNTAILCP